MDMASSVSDCHSHEGARKKAAGVGKICIPLHHRVRSTSLDKGSSSCWVCLPSSPLLWRGTLGTRKCGWHLWSVTRVLQWAQHYTPVWDSEFQSSLKSNTFKGQGVIWSVSQVHSCTGKGSAGVSLIKFILIVRPLCTKSRNVIIQY